MIEEDGTKSPKERDRLTLTGRRSQRERDYQKGRMMTNHNF